MAQKLAEKVPHPGMIAPRDQGSLVRLNISFINHFRRLGKLPAKSEFPWHTSGDLAHRPLPIAGHFAQRLANCRGGRTSISVL
jgi:hypothetical protein